MFSVTKMSRALLAAAPIFASLPLLLCSVGASAHGGGLEEVLVTSSRSQRNLDDTPLRVQILGAEELQEKSNMKPGDIRMLLNESTGIQVQQTSATSFSSGIRIQGLDGRYTQLLRDGLPIYAGFSGSLSLLQITPLDLKQVEVVKGASSTLYGGGAIAGLVNLVSKTPDGDTDNSALLNLTSAGGLDASAYHSSSSGKHGVTLFGSYNVSEAYEAASNGFSAIPEFERVTFVPRWFYTVNDATRLDVGVGIVEENRLGGSMNYIDGRANNEYFERNDSSRFYTRAGLEHSFENGMELTFKNTQNWFDRSLEIPTFTFEGEQFSSFSELSLFNNVDSGSWVLGLNVLGEEFDQKLLASAFDHSYKQSIVGAFGQYTLDVSNEWVLEGGLRVDSHSDYGNFVLPMASALYMPMDDLTLRLGGGFGYKTPTVFISEAEEIHYQYLVPINPDDFEGETSRGINFDINHRYEIDHGLTLDSNLLLFYTEINDSMYITEQGNQFVFAQREGLTQTRGVELNLAFGMGEWRYFVGYTFVDSTQEEATGDTDLPLVSKHRFNQVLVWEREDDFRIGLEAYYFSPQEREFDTRGESYWIFGLMMEKHFSQQVTGFLNFENFSDTRQTKFEDINTGDAVKPVFRDIYAPLDGFVVNGGVRLKW